MIDDDDKTIVILIIRIMMIKLIIIRIIMIKLIIIIMIMIIAIINSNTITTIFLKISQKLIEELSIFNFQRSMDKI